MKRGLLGLIMGAMVTVTAAPQAVVFAESSRRVRTPGVHHRVQNQRQRTREGLKSGELTKGEAKEIRSDMKDINEKRKDYRSDGTVTKEERLDLHRDLNESSRNIYQEKHDENTRKELPPSRRVQTQKNRIQQGVESGELTRGEARREAADLREINQDRREMKHDADGLTADERAELQRRLDAESEDIYQQKHDRQER